MHLLQSGNPLVIIRDILGHSDIKTTEVYAKADLEMRREALKKAAPESPTPVIRSWMKNKVSGVNYFLRQRQLKLSFLPQP
jgi:integrase/recombinase XerD